MVFLGFGKYVRSDRIYAIEPLRHEDRRSGSRTRVWVDGIMLNNETQVFDLDQMPIASLAGLELYVGFQETPVEFEAPGVHCGALVLWTRDR